MKEYLERAQVVALNEIAKQLTRLNDKIDEITHKGYLEVKTSEAE